MIGSTFYFLRQAVQNIRRNRTVHILSLGTIVASLLILGAFLFLFGNLNNWLRQWGSDLSMSVYLKDEISAYKRDKIDSFIRGLPGARTIRYISKEDAMNELKGAFRDEVDFLKELNRNPLPASYEVIFETNGAGETDPEPIKRQLESLDGVEEVQHSSQWLKKIDGFLDLVRLVGYIVGGLLCLCVVFIVTNTIKLTIYLRRDEIKILKLVGATDWFVKLPFMLEGMIEGLMGGGATLLTLYLGYLAFSTKEIYLIGPSPLRLVFLQTEHVAIILFLSTLLGIIGSFIAIGRFFDVS